MIKKITIEVIPHLEQRYNTVGDWQFTRDAEGKATELSIKVSEIGDGNDANMLIAIHEFAEAIMCELGGVKEEEVDKFDMEWVPERVHYSTDEKTSEPGEEYYAPYYRQHQVATGIERLIAAQLWINWSRYEFFVDRLCKQTEEHFAAERDKVEEAQESQEPVTRPRNLNPIGTDDDDIPF